MKRNNLLCGAVLLGITLFCTSCMVGRRQIKSPDLKLPSEIVQGKADSLTLADLAWWNIYTDSTLTALIERTLAYNKDLLMASARVQRMQALSRSAKADRLPSITGSMYAETEHNEYVASRPFRVNAGAVHAYVRLPGDATTYLSEVTAGTQMLVVDYTGATSIATAGRVKIEVRPMLLVEAKVGDKTGAVFLQNAETIRLTAPDGTPVSVVTLKPGDKVLCRTDEAGRHFGMRIKEDIQEK